MMLGTRVKRKPPLRRERLRLLRRKIVWIPLSLLVLLASAVWITDAWYRYHEAILWEIGSGIRARFDDFTHDFRDGDPQVLATYYAAEFSGQGFGFETRRQLSEEGGILVEEWTAPAGVRRDREQMLAELLAYRQQLHEATQTKFKMVFLNEYSDNTAHVYLRFQVYAKDSQGHPTEDRGHFNIDLVRRDGQWQIVRQELVNGWRVTGVDSRYFVDVTEAVGIDFNTGASEIFEHLHHNFAIVDRAAGGATSGDYDGDGDPDLFLCGFQGSKLFRNTGQGAFENVAAAAFAPSDQEKLRYAQGCLFADYNNDGHLDLFIIKTPRVTRAFFLQDWPLESAEALLAFFHASPDNAQRLAHLFEQPQEALASLLQQSPEALPALVDDLVARWRSRLSNRLLKNNGDGTFSDVTEAAGLAFNSYSTTAGFADIDNDGDADLYVGVYGPARQHSPDPPFHDRYGLPNRLYRNNGDGTFTDISAAAGVDDTGWTLGMTFWDYDNDGDQDLYVANDFGYNTLFRNDGSGRFDEVAKEAGALDYGFGMSASPGDFDNDGDMDLYVSNIYSGTTWYIQHTIMQFLWVRFVDPSRTWRSLGVAAQTYDKMGGLGGIRTIGKKFGEGNSLLENRGDGTFKSIGVAKGVNMAGWAGGSNFFDFDNDGDLNIHSVNGWITGKKYTDL